MIMQGNQEGDGMVTEFYVKYGFDETNLMYYEDYPGIPKVKISFKLV